MCRPCFYAYRRDWYWKNADKLRAQNTERERKRRAADPDRHRAYWREYKQAHPEQREAQRERLLQNPAEHEKAKARWRDYQRRRRERLGGKTPRRLLPLLLERQGNRCALCKRPLPKTRRYVHVDHILPAALGGQNDLPNLQAAHARCNIQKKAKVVEAQMFLA